MTVPASSDDWVSTCATSEPCTTTSVLIVPTWSATLSLALSATRRTIPRASYFLKPSAATVKSYEPMGNELNRKSPLPFVVPL